MKKKKTNAWPKNSWAGGNFRPGENLNLIEELFSFD